MNYATSYQLAHSNPALTQPYFSTPQLHHKQYQPGVRRYDIQKNMQSTGILSEYYLPKEAQPVTSQINGNHLAGKRNQSQPPIPPPANPTQRNLSQQQHYLQQIARLKQQLRQKEEEKLVSSREPLKIRQNQTQVEYFNRINKSLFDKKRLENQKLENSVVLGHQITQKGRLKKIQDFQKEAQQAKRLEDLKKQREEQLLERVEMIQKARQYRDHLEMQQRLKQKIDKEEDYDRRSNLPPIQQNPPPEPGQISHQPPHSQFEQHANSFYESEQNFTPPRVMFTKKSPKTLSFNPITGSLRDTSQYMFGTTHPYPLPRESSNPFLPTQKNLTRISSDFSLLPAFRQPQYTKANPKFSPSFPITGAAQLNPTIFKPEFKENASQFYGEDRPRAKGYQEKNLAEYGNMMLKPGYR